VEHVFIWALLTVLSVAVVALSVLAYHVIHQQGRLILRIEALERPAEAAGSPEPPQPPQGLPVGAMVEPFELPSMSGERVSLADYRGRRVVLVHWSPGCGFCTQIAQELADLEPRLRLRDTELVIVSYGDAEANQALVETGLLCPILLQAPGEPLPAFHGLGTPVAYLLDEQGRVAAPLALGAIQVPELVRTAAERVKRLQTERPIAESRIDRDGLKPGTKAPTFELEDVRGGAVSLDDYRGRRVLLVFSDPDCGPCNALLPQLARVQHEATLVMVSRGEPDVNRAKAEEHGIQFPVLSQRGWNLSKKYAIFATPVAFLIDEHGVIAREVAKGAQEIITLAAEASARREAPVAH
jgi:peroxiredoxin